MLGRMPARVGIVVRTRHRPAFLTRALRDIAAQSWIDYRVVVVNDGGEPAEIDGAVAEAAVDGVEIVHIAPGAGGRCVAANVGIRALDTDYVVLHDDDDRWHPQFLTRTVAWLDASPGDAAVSVTTEIVYEERRGAEWVQVGRAPFWAGMQRISLSEMMSVNRAVPISVLYRRSVHDEVGWYDETLDAVEDWDFYLRILRAQGIGFISSEPLAFWVQRPDAVGGDANSMFGLASEHSRDDAVVRDRALSEWVRREGAGLPLYMAAADAEMRAHVDRAVGDAVDRIVNRVREEMRADLRAEIDAHQPVMSRLRALRRRLAGR